MLNVMTQLHSMTLSNFKYRHKKNTLLIILLVQLLKKWFHRVMLSPYIYYLLNGCGMAASVC